MSLDGADQDDAGLLIAELEGLLGPSLVPVAPSCLDAVEFEASDCIAGQGELQALDCALDDLPWNECFATSLVPDTLDGFSAFDPTVFTQSLPTPFDNGNSQPPRLTPAQGDGSRVASREPQNECCPPPRKRLTMKNRIELLREKADELTFELQAAELKSQAHAAVNRAAGDTATHESMQQRLPRSQVIAMWEEVATRQLRLREKAERENVHLRKLVNSQRRYLMSVDSQLKKRPHQQVRSNLLFNVDLCSLLTTGVSVGGDRRLMLLPASSAL